MRIALMVLAWLACNAFAQAPGKLEPVPEIPPPAVAPLDDPSLEPEITIREQGGDRIEEYRIAGRLYAIKITPSHGVPYFLIDEQGDGNFSRHDGPGEGLSVPMWVIREF